MSPSRQRGKPVFDPSAIDQDLDDLWPTPNLAMQKPAPTAAPKAEAVSAPPAPSARPAAPAPPTASPPTPARVHAPVRSAAVNGHPGDQRRPGAVKAVNSSVKRTRPPEVLLSAEVYDELYRVQIAEKKVRRGLARTMGTIVLDAIEAHAARLETTWADQQSTVGEGQLFERPSSNAVPRRRRHVSAPRTVVLSGVTAANGQRLDNLIHDWGAGTRSALVEQALRYEFGQLTG